MPCRPISASLATLAVAFAGGVVPVRAQGFGLNEIGSCAVARGYATVAAPCHDATTVFWNPAGAMSLSGWTATAGLAVVAINGRFDQDTTGRHFSGDDPVSIVPHVFVNYHPAHSRVAYGLGVYVPYGLTSRWHDDFPGRFLALRASLTTVYVQPNIAWQASSRWAVGGGPVLGRSRVKLIRAIDLASQVADPRTGTTFAMLGIRRETEFARAQLEGTATAVGAQIGVWGRPTDDWSVGFRALSPLRFRYDDAHASFTQVPTGLVVGGSLPHTPLVAGTAVDALLAPQFAAGGPLVDQHVSTRIVHPAQLQLGVAYSGLARWLLEADYAWVGWRAFKDIPIDFAGPAADQSRVLIEDYRNSSAFRVGAEYTVQAGGLTLRAGVDGISSAAPDETVTPLLPEQGRAYWTLGASLPLGHAWDVDAAYAHIRTPGARGRIIERDARRQSATDLNSGVFHLSANVFSITLNATF